jgi:hypothetical protein
LWWLLIIDYWLLTVGCPLSIVDGWLSTVECMLWDMNFVLGKTGGKTFSVMVLSLVRTVGYCPLIVDCWLSTLDCRLSTVDCRLSTIECMLWDMNFVLGQRGGKRRNIVCYGAVACKECWLLRIDCWLFTVDCSLLNVDCRLSNACCGTWTSFWEK